MKKIEERARYAVFRHSAAHLMNSISVSARLMERNLKGKIANAEEKVGHLAEELYWQLKKHKSELPADILKGREAALSTLHRLKELLSTPMTDEDRKLSKKAQLEAEDLRTGMLNCVARLEEMYLEFH